MSDHYRRYAPTPFDTPDDARYWTAEINRADDEAEDQRREAHDMGADVRVEPCRCRGDDCWACGVRRVFERWGAS